MKCVICKQEFEGKRATAKYCSAKCRMQAVRVSATVSATKVSATDDNVALSGPLSVYSERRWSYLKGKGYVWHEPTARAYRPAEPNELTALAIKGQPVIMAITVPGDPAYKSIARAG